MAITYLVGDFAADQLHKRFRRSYRSPYLPRVADPDDTPEWLGRPGNLPVADVRDAAEKFDAEDPMLWEFQMTVYLRERAGVTAAGVRADSARDHDYAVDYALQACCFHDWEVVSRYDNVNPVLGTGERGNRVTCRRCGRTDVHITWRNNYSGD
jgi:hypothetical protein